MYRNRLVVRNWLTQLWRLQVQICRVSQEAQDLRAPVVQVKSLGSLLENSPFLGGGSVFLFYSGLPLIGYGSPTLRRATALLYQIKCPFHMKTPLQQHLE